MITAVAQPSHGGFARMHIICLLLVRSTTKAISGVASTPFNTADQNNIFTSLMDRGPSPFPAVRTSFALPPSMETKTAQSSQ
jgi:hypothetical protein